jgi:PAS domain S-box-containing protein
LNLYAVLSLCASTVSIVLGLSVYFLNRKSSLNKLFMLAMFLNAYWAFCTFGKTQADSISTAFLWSKALSFWPLLVPLMLHFTLAFTESDLLKRKFIYIALYMPALLFSVIDFTTNWISGTVVLAPWGYITLLPVNSMVANIGGIWSAILGLLIIFFFTQYYNRIGDRTKKQQTKFVAFGFAVPILLSLVTDSIFPAMNIDFPGFGSISGSITSVFVVYAMLRYNLFSFRPEIAAENVFSAMPDSVILVTLDGKIVQVNQSFLELTGYCKEEVAGKTVKELLQKSSLANQGLMVQQLIVQLHQLSEIRNYEISFRIKSGAERMGLLSCSMVRNSRGQDVGIALVLHDITERKEMELKLLRSERFASIGELATILGHDLRNPLSGIRGATFFLRRKHSNVWDREDLAMFESIDKSIGYSDKIINDLLDYSREIRLDLAPVTPKMLLKESLMLLAVPEDVYLVDETSDQLGFYADSVKVCRAFVNVIKNAVDAMPEGGRLVVKSEVVGEFVVFSFKDSGLGMSVETLDRLWSPLFTTKAKGMGFGLAICRRFVEAHGGCVSVDSVVGEGTTVRVDLPLFLNKKPEIVGVSE